MVKLIHNLKSAIVFLIEHEKCYYIGLLVQYCALNSYHACLVARTSRGVDYLYLIVVSWVDGIFFDDLDDYDKKTHLQFAMHTHVV
jgi:hypothetical protein